MFGPTMENHLKQFNDDLKKYGINELPNVVSVHDIRQYVNLGLMTIKEVLVHLGYTTKMDSNGIFTKV